MVVIELMRNSFKLVIFYVSYVEVTHKPTVSSIIWFLNSACSFHLLTFIIVVWYWNVFFWARVAKFYGWLLFSVLKIYFNWNFVGFFTPSRLAQFFCTFWASLYIKEEVSIYIYKFLNLFVLLRIFDEGSVPEMRIWSVLLIKSDLKVCIRNSRSLFLYLQSSHADLSSFVFAPSCYQRRLLQMYEKRLLLRCKHHF